MNDVSTRFFFFNDSASTPNGLAASRTNFRLPPEAIKQFRATFSDGEFFFENLLDPAIHQETSISVT